MAFTYTTLLTEDLGDEQRRKWFGYDVSTGGMLLHMRMEGKATDGNPDIKVIDAEIFLPGDQVSGMGSISWTQLRDEDIGRGARRFTRAYVTPSGHTLVHRYTRVVFPWLRSTRTMYVDEHIYIVEHAALSGTDIVRTAGVGQRSIAVGRTSVTSSNSLNGNGSASWQDVLVATSGSALQVQFTAKANDSVHANLILTVQNTLGTSFLVEPRITLDGTEIARGSRFVPTFLSGYNDYALSADISGLSAGTRTLKAQLLIGGTPTTVLCLSGTHRGKIEYRLFR